VIYLIFVIVAFASGLVRPPAWCMLICPTLCIVVLLAAGVPKDNPALGYFFGVGGAVLSLAAGLLAYGLGTIWYRRR
jgi:peptidoglycan/LPS O-acetylase OafA/YrhL